MQPVALRVNRPSPGPPKRVYLEQYGCATTQAEADMIRGILQERGHRLVPALEEADTALIVTCTVVDRTERNMLHRIRDFTETGKEVVVSGCMASSQVDRIKHASPRALVLPPQYLHQVGELIEQGEAEFCYQPKVGLPKARQGVVDTVVINEGCSGKCTFCITKIARPGLRSYPVEGIVEDVRRAVHAGAVEIRLTSQDAGAYGLDSGKNLPDLIRAVLDAVPGEYRLRIGMLNPWTLRNHLDALLQVMEDPRVFRFLHLPVQSGSDRILAAMGRNHRAAEIATFVDRARDAHPDMCIHTDVIAGFPGETDEDHRATLDLLKRMNPDVVNITRFSPRDGTTAVHLHEDVGVHGRVMKQRSRDLTALRFRLSRAVNTSWVGREVECIVTEPGKPGTVLARTPEYRQVVLPGLPLGTRVRARIVEGRDVDLVGEVVGVD